MSLKRRKGHKSHYNHIHTSGVFFSSASSLFLFFFSSSVFFSGSMLMTRRRQQTTKTMTTKRQVVQGMMILLYFNPRKNTRKERRQDMRENKFTDEDHHDILCHYYRHRKMVWYIEIEYGFAREEEKIDFLLHHVLWVHLRLSLCLIQVWLLPLF